MKIVLPILVILTAFAGASAVMNANTAADLVFTQLLDENITGRSVLALDGMVSRGTEMGAWQYEVTAPFDGYLVLVDDMVYANWEHPCRWVFVSPDGDMQVIRMTTPPDALERMTVTHTCLPEAEGKGQYEEFIAWFVPNVQSSPAQAEHVYALVISGGASSGSNHIRYYGDVQFIYNVLAHDYLLPDDHIIVCFADGLNPNPDQSGGLNSNPDFDDDGDSDIIYDATTAGVNSGFSDIASMVGADDHLFVFTTDHGGSGKLLDSPPEAYLNLWGSSLNDDTYQTTIAGLTYASCHAIMEQCYSGGFLLEHITGTSGYPSSFASAANGYESSWAGATYPEYDEYAYYWTGAMHGSIPPSSGPGPGALPGNPDMNGDGCVSFYEAANRATAWDTYAQSGQEHPQWDDDPDTCGNLYYLGGLIQVGIGTQGDPAQPATGSLTIDGNPLSSVSTVRFGLNAPGEVSVLVYDMSGHAVQNLVSGELSAGLHSVSWSTDGLAAGVYMVRFMTDDFTESLRAVKF
ncbi:MAG: T9SS type A sorting domain-containing protein [Candidatus Fermentibacteraceae bacterium]|nr:T9SS type A sorting domain-containing protein [Candidatus Fermentibacteraceae bacterium]